VMWQGKVVERGPTAQVLGSPASPYTQALLASVPRPGWTPRRAVALLGQVPGGPPDAPDAPSTPRED
jgi:oligopeptide transport system ATP-binding protein